MTDLPERPLKIAYLSDLDPRETWSYSGGNARLLAAVETFADVTVLSSGWHGADLIRRMINKLPEAWAMRLRFRAHIMLSRWIARGVRRELAQGDYDVLLGAYSFHSLLNIGEVPGITTVFTSDATPTVYKNSDVGAAFGSFLSISRLLDPWILRAETKTFRAADLLLWPSDWLADGAVKLYDLNPETSKTVPWGAGIDRPPVETLRIENPMDDGIRLLLVGRNWFMKGGPLAVDVLDKFGAQGVAAHLTVIGCQPPDFHMRENMTVHVNLDKSNPGELAVLESLYRDAHFMVMPSFESYGFAFCEASAYALPALCLRIGGVPVVDGINGFALPKDATAQEFTDKIAALKSDPPAYTALRQSSRDYYESALNWDAWGQCAETLIRSAVAAKSIPTPRHKSPFPPEPC